MFWLWIGIAILFGLGTGGWFGYWYGRWYEVHEHIEKLRKQISLEQDNKAGEYKIWKSWR